MKKAGIYIHFPFCRRACFYCHFFKKKSRPPSIAAYLQALAQEMRLRRDTVLVSSTGTIGAVDSVYIGGGSPSLLTAEQLGSLLAAAQNNFCLTRNAEITLEANPEDIDAPQLWGFRQAGVNRLSIGVQSFQEKDLRCLKRNHSAAQGRHAVELALAAGFTNFSIDLIIGLESQTARSMEANFRAIAALKPSHVSVYILEGVPRPAADSRDARFYFQARQSLLDLGFEHYEVSNFCQPGRASRHNLKYWRSGAYFGLGPSAAGYLDGVDYRNFSDLKKYGAAVQDGKLPLVKTRQSDPCKRRIITGLRLFEGIPASVFKSFPIPTDFLLTEGFLVRRGPNLAVPPEKILLLNEILEYFL